MNALTIGAANTGSAFTGNLPPGRFDPFTDPDLPNFTSAMGLGFKKSVKRELLLDGGITPVMIAASGVDGVELAPLALGTSHFGLKVARPQLGGVQSSTRRAFSFEVFLA
jgi:hypothetical protein